MHSPETDSRILVVGPSWVGDMVMAQSLLKLLRERHPDSPIDIVAPGWSVPVVARMPEVDRPIVLDTGHGEFGLAKRRALAKSLTGYGRAIVLPRSAKSALVPWFADIPRRTGYRGEMRFGLLNDIRPFDKTVLDQTVKRFVYLGLEPGESLPSDLPQPALDTDSGNQRAFLAAQGLDDEKPVIAMMPGAEYGPAKCWPLEHFADLARQLLGEGFAVWVLGSAKDAPAGEQIAASAGGVVNLCGKTSLEDVIDVLALAEQVVSNDSGLMHVAAAAGCFVHGIYGSSSPAFTPPLTARRDIHTLSLDCSPCFKRECPLGHLDCLKKLETSGVFASIMQQKA